MILLVTLLILAVAMPVFALVNDSIESQDIKEADGTSGQDTDSGSGIKTGHIQDSAVTTNKIADGAVTDTKLSGTISASKIEDGVFQKKYANVVVVAKSGGDYTSPVSALSAITDASSSNPYLVKVMPGLYDLGTSSLQMKSYVDLEGSGPDSTIITTSNYNSNSGTCTVGTILMANNSSIFNIKVENMPPSQSQSGNLVAALVFNDVEASAEKVIVLVGTDTVDGGNSNGVCSSGESARALLNNVYIETHNVRDQSNPIILLDGGSVTLKNSKLAGFLPNGNGDSYGINSDVGSGVVNVINSVIEINATYPHGIFADGYEVLVMNSIISLNIAGEGAAEGFYATTDFSVINSVITGNGSIDYYDGTTGNLVRIANSLIQGDVEDLENARFVNNYDEDFEAITDQ